MIYACRIYAPNYPLLQYLPNRAEPYALPILVRQQCTSCSPANPAPHYITQMRPTARHGHPSPQTQARNIAQTMTNRYRGICPSRPIRLASKKKAPNVPRVSKLTRRTTCRDTCHLGLPEHLGLLARGRLAI